jgi:tRNA A37 N6-isopentenylltransferase MiaA
VWGRGKVPVVVGGTMMYHQWLVHGQPDAPPSDPATAALVAAELAPLARGNTLISTENGSGDSKITVQIPKGCQSMTL